MKWSMSLSAKVFAIAGLMAGAALPASAETLYRSVSVDTSVIAAWNPALAQNIRTTLQAQLNRSFADRLTSSRAAPQLVVKITNVQQAALPDSDGWRRSSGGGGGSNDYMNGEALVVANGRVLAAHPMLSALDANYAGKWNQQDADQKRLAALSWQYAAWLRREMASY